MLRIVLVALLVSLAGVARADRVHLKSGAVIEGKATRAAGQVLVEVESGQIGLSVDEVDRIERGASPVQEFEAKREAEAAKRAEEVRVTVQPPVAYATPVYPWYWGGHDVSRRHRDRDRDHCPGPRCARKPTTRRTDGRPDWPIAGTKDPFDYLRDSR